MAKGLKRSINRATKQSGVIRKQVIPVKNLAISVAGTTGVGYGTAVAGDLPEGNILLLGAIAYLQFSKNGDTDLQDAFDGDYSVGSAPTGDATLSGAEVDIIPSTALGAATAGLSPVVRGAQGAQAMLDNTDNSLEININLLIDDANISGVADMLVDGYIEVAYIVMGDD